MLLVDEIFLIIAINLYCLQRFPELRWSSSWVLYIYVYIYIYIYIYIFVFKYSQKLHWTNDSFLLEKPNVWPFSNKFCLSSVIYSVKNAFFTPVHILCKFMWLWLINMCASSAAIANASYRILFFKHKSVRACFELAHMCSWWIFLSISRFWFSNKLSILIKQKNHVMLFPGKLFRET